MRIALLMAGSLLVTACDQRPREGDMAGMATDTAMSGADVDGAFAEDPPAAQAFVRAAALSDMFEIEAGNLAVGKAESDEARTFARMMITDHTRSTQELKQAVAETGKTFEMPGELDGEHQAQLDILRSLNGADFEREYMSQQLAAHRKALALLKSYGGAGDTAELRQFAQGMIPVVQKHHDWLETNAPVPGPQGAQMPAPTNTPTATP